MITYNDIYLHALALIGETPSDATADYSDRADLLFPDVIASLGDASTLDGWSPAKVQKTDQFALDAMLEPAAAELLASFLIEPEDHDFAARLAERSARTARIAADVGSVRDVYPDGE